MDFFQFVLIISILLLLLLKRLTVCCVTSQGMITMPLAEIVIIEVGSAIAKSLLQLWMKDIPIASVASSTILEILKLYTTDKISQWK
jgi:hypothetical protein